MWPALLRDERGNVTIIVATTMLIFIAMAGFAFDFGRFFLIQGRDQLAADAAAVAASIAYGTAANTAAATTEGCVVAALNGVNVTCTAPIPTNIVETKIVSSPTVPGGTAAHVIIHSTLNYSAFGALLAPNGRTSLPVSAQAWAEIPTAGPGCLVALDGLSAAASAAITLNGSASVNASLCLVLAGGAIDLNGAASLTASSVTTSSAINLTGSAQLVTSGQQKQNFVFTPNATQPTDPLASNPLVTAALGRLTTVAADTSTLVSNVVGTLLSSSLLSSLTSFSPPCIGNRGTVPSGLYLNLNLNTAGCTYAVTAPITVGGTMSFTAPNITVNFVGGGTNGINKLQAASTGDLINATGNTFNIYSGVSTTAVPSDLSIGCTALFSTGGCSASDIDTNTYNILGGVKTNDGTLVFGNGNFAISGGVSIANGAPCAAGNTLQFGNGTNFIVADTGITLNGGCFTTGSDTNHDINSGSATGNGIVNSSGSPVITLGSGPYTINGNITLGGASTSTGTGINIATTGNVSIGGSALVNWSAPASAPFLISTTSNANAAFLFSGGTSGTLLNGMIYAPNGGIQLTGSGSINAGVLSVNLCFSLVANTILLSGGSVAASVCPAAGTTGTVALIE